MGHDYRFAIDEDAVEGLLAAGSLENLVHNLDQVAAALFFKLFENGLTEDFRRVGRRNNPAFRSDDVEVTHAGNGFPGVFAQARYFYSGQSRHVASAA